MSMAAAPAFQTPARAAVAKMKITRVRVYAPPDPNPLFNQSDMVVTVETDAGITGIGEGGAKDTLEQCAGRLIGQDPHYIERLWQDMSRSFFYPPAAKRLHALGALDLALWDIKGKAHGLPVHALLGGMVRNYCECYNTAGIIPGIKPGMSISERAHATIEAGYRAFRMGAADAAPTAPSTPASASTSSTRTASRRAKASAKTAIGASTSTSASISPTPSAAASSSRISRRSSSKTRCAPKPSSRIFPILRALVKVPLAAGEEWGNRWDFNRLVENHDIDFLRATLPNVGGITEMMKIAAICETHFVGIVPHFTGPIATAALVNTLGHIQRPGADGIQLPRPHQSAGSRLPGFQTRQALPQRPPRPGRGARHEAIEVDRRNHRAHPQPAALLPAGWIDYQLVIRGRYH